MLAKNTPYYFFHFSRREQQIMALSMKDFSHKMIADRLHISKHTVDTQFKRLHEKLQIHTMGCLMTYALYHGFAYDEATQQVTYWGKVVEC
jgi:DNA-binding NarL/FixJ family response regulator